MSAHTFRHFKDAALNASLKYMPKYSGNDYELRIGRTKLEDKGEYIVRAVNSFGSKEESAVLNVERKFRVTVWIVTVLCYVCVL